MSDRPAAAPDTERVPPALHDALRQHFGEMLSPREYEAIERIVAAQGAAPRAEGLREALEHVLDVWPAPSPEEFARLHRVLTGHDSCSSRPSDERVPESEATR